MSSAGHRMAKTFPGDWENPVGGLGFHIPAGLCCPPRMTKPLTKLILSIFNVISFFQPLPSALVNGGLCLWSPLLLYQEQTPTYLNCTTGGRISSSTWRSSNTRLHNGSCAPLTCREGHYYLWKGPYVGTKSASTGVPWSLWAFWSFFQKWGVRVAFENVTRRVNIPQIRRWVDMRKWMCSPGSWSGAALHNWWVLIFSEASEHSSRLPCQCAFFHKFLNSKQNRGRKT